MKRIEAYPYWAALVLPLLLVIAFNISPRPSSLDSGLVNARIELQTGNPAAAYRYLNLAAQASSNRPDIWELAGQTAWKAGLVDQAIQSYKVAQGMGRLSTPSLETLGDAYLQTGYRTLALLSWKEFLDLNPSDVNVIKKVEAIYLEDRNWLALMDIYKRHLDLNPQEASIAFSLAEIAAIYTPDQAAQWSEQALKVDATYTARANSLQAGLILADSQKDEAYRWTLIGRTLGSLDAWSIAIEAFQRAVQVNPNYGEAWAFLGEAHQQTGQDGAADLARAEKLSPDSLLVKALQAVRLRRLGQPENALAYLYDIAALEPSNPIWQTELGNTLAQMGDLEGAIGHFQAATKLKPQDPSYYRQLAAFSIQYGYQLQTDGIEAARQANILDPEDPQNSDLMGQVFLRLGDLTNAERFFIHALEISPNYGPGLLHMGIIYLEQNKIEQARDVFQKIVTQEPGSSIAQQAQRLLQLNSP